MKTKNNGVKLKTIKIGPLAAWSERRYGYISKLDGSVNWREYKVKGYEPAFNVIIRFDQLLGRRPDDLINKVLAERVTEYLTKGL